MRFRKWLTVSLVVLSVFIWGNDRVVVYAEGAATDTEQAAYIPANTTIEVILTETVSSKTAKAGDPLHFMTKNALLINNVNIIPAGSVVIGKIKTAEGASAFGKDGKLEFTIDSVKTLNDVLVPLYGAASYVSTKKSPTAWTVIKSAFSEGENIQCYAGTVYDASVTENTYLGVSLENLSTVFAALSANTVSIKL